jgi:hypothetical protein
MVQARMSPFARRQHDFGGSLYREPCPTCGAAPLCWCQQPTGKVCHDPHAARRGRQVPERFGRVPRLGFHKGMNR